MLLCMYVTVYNINVLLITYTVNNNYYSNSNSMYSNYAYTIIDS